MTMAASPGERRLFLGGLGPSVTQDDVRAQLGRFGAVSSVELVSRVNELGLPEKTFAYANVRLSDGDLKKCMSALNKTTWKGGTLQVQLAKESFLHRLAEERLRAKAQQEACPQGGSTVNPPTVLELHMKKAVPGTEVPGHKDWVVSKFGRVLPVLHLRSQNRRKILKYDPSKYCHNLKKFEQDVADPVSISDLTWKLEGGEDAMSKKRQGQFPAFRSHPAKRAKVEGSPRPSSGAAGRPEPPSPRPQPAASKEALKPRTGSLHASKPLGARSRNVTSDDDVDSEEELKAMIAEEKSRRPGLPETNGSGRDSFEVVSCDFKPNPPGAGGRPRAPLSDSPAQLAEDDQEYDSGDTDEIIACRKNGDQSKDEPKTSPKKKPKAKAKASVRNGTERARATCGSDEREAADCSRRVTKKPGGASPGSEGGESEEDLDYEAMMTNCYRLDLTLADLEKLATEAAEGPGGSARRAKRALPEGEGTGSARKTKKAPKGARCINPTDILASLLEGDEKARDQNPLKESAPKSKFQAFRGVGALYGGETPTRPLPNGEITAHAKAPNSLKQAASPTLGKRAFDLNTPSRNEMSVPQDGREAEGANSSPRRPKNPPRRRAANGEQQLGAGSSPSPGSASGLTPSGAKKPSRLPAETCRMDSGGHGGLGAPAVGDPRRERGDPVTLGPPPGRASSRVPGKDSPGTVQKDAEGPRDAPAEAAGPQKPSQDNEKRLAALEERQRARELQKQLVHSALSGLDGRPVSKPTHILFSSDSEEETDVRDDACEKPLPGSGGKQDSKASGKLFESSEDEEEAEEDRARFQIKPQFEGKAGKKLMNLQSHFGADDRFRMDARFLESESEEEEEELKEAPTAEEEELVAEKRKNLELLRNILHVGQQAPKPSREEAASRRFRNVVRYDPTRLDHATFERKAEPEEKESKAKRRKKRAEAEALPAVSKDQYYSIAADLKERFRAPEPEPEAGAGSPGSETPEVGETAGPPPGSGEFTFSFFGPDVGKHEEAPYRVETKTAGRKAWQQDPRFQDSSSEEEEEEEEEEPQPPDGSTAAAQPEEIPVSKALSSRFFFFSEDDERLRAGPGSFWQGSGSQPSGEDWESRTLALLQDCRKKHKAARRKAKP
ncbi:nucleolar protein 8 [Sminthopsis crassicaudata]|uniref:nucleolar protein 8 n=1 Tax=Sminthopsis crassicaudata TaxID=9301 RepID=UPI003D6900CD